MIHELLLALRCEERCAAILRVTFSSTATREPPSTLSATLHHHLEHFMLQS